MPARSCSRSAEQSAPIVARDQATDHALSAPALRATSSHASRAIDVVAIDAKRSREQPYPGMPRLLTSDNLGSAAPPRSTTPLV